MIARNSKSYPYLAIAQHYNIPYAKVLDYADNVFRSYIIPYTDWKREVWNLEVDRREKTKLQSDKD